MVPSGLGGFLVQVGQQLSVRPQGGLVDQDTGGPGSSWLPINVSAGTSITAG